MTKAIHVAAKRNKETITVTELEKIQNLVRKLQLEFLKYADKKLKGKPPNLQDDYDELVRLLSKLFGVEKK